MDRYWVECSLDARQGNIPAANISPVLLPALQRGQKICVVRSALPHLHPGDLQLARGRQHSRSHNHSQSLATTNSLPPPTHTTPHRLAHTTHKHSRTPHTRTHPTHSHSVTQLGMISELSTVTSALARKCSICLPAKYPGDWGAREVITRPHHWPNPPCLYGRAQTITATKTISLGCANTPTD